MQYNWNCPRIHPVKILEKLLKQFWKVVEIPRLSFRFFGYNTL